MGWLGGLLDGANTVLRSRCGGGLGGATKGPVVGGAAVGLELVLEIGAVVQTVGPGVDEGGGGGEVVVPVLGILEEGIDVKDASEERDVGGVVDAVGVRITAGVEVAVGDLEQCGRVLAVAV
jgi:hypothetical protein